MENNIVRLAVQKSGRLSDESFDLVAQCGIRVNRQDHRLKASATNFPMELLYLRDDDIPEYVAAGVADLGIVGENLIIEKQKEVRTIKTLGFGKCRLSIAVPRSLNYESKRDLNGLTIATTYPRSLSRFLEEHGIKANIREIRGSTEIAPSVGLAEAVCDLVSSGSTLLRHGLEETHVVFESQAALIASNQLSPEKQSVLDRWLFRLDAVLNARECKYILLNAPDESLEQIVKTLPSLRSPTVVPLAEEGWSSVHAVINENRFWEVLEQLKDLGSTGILVCPIEKMIIDDEVLP